MSTAKCIYFDGRRTFVRHGKGKNGDYSIFEVELYRTIYKIIYFYTTDTYKILSKR